MKISELINELKEAKKDFGDKELLIYQSPYTSFADLYNNIDGVSFGLVNSEKSDKLVDFPKGTYIIMSL